jgi:hypothetical protein
MNKQEELIKMYVDGYNAFNMKKMLAPLHSKIVFENHVKGELQMKLEGIKSFKKQAQKGIEMFSKRKQEFLSMDHEEGKTTTIVNYSGTLKVSIGDQMKKGQVMNLSGKSIFTFQDDRIIKIEDHS